MALGRAAMWIADASGPSARFGNPKIAIPFIGWQEERGFDVRIRGERQHQERRFERRCPRDRPRRMPLPAVAMDAVRF